MSASHEEREASSRVDWLGRRGREFADGWGGHCWFGCLCGRWWKWIRHDWVTRCPKMSGGWDGTVSRGKVQVQQAEHTFDVEFLRLTHWILLFYSIPLLVLLSIWPLLAFACSL